MHAVVCCALQGYLMVLYVTPLSLIGVAYMWLLLLVFLVPPSQHAYLQLLDALAVDGSRSQAVVRSRPQVQYHHWVGTVQHAVRCSLYYGSLYVWQC